MPAVQIARELGHTTGSLRTWERKNDKPLKNDPDPDQLTLAKLKRENAHLRKNSITSPNTKTATASLVFIENLAAKVYPFPRKW